MEEDIRLKFDKRLQTPEPDLVAMLSAIDQLKVAFKYEAKLTPAATLKLKRSVIITSAGASTRIEGSLLNDDQVEKIMKEMNIQKFQDRDSQEVVGYIEVLENVFESYEKLNLRESTIKHLHSELLKASDKDKLHKGEYKKKENIVGVMGDDGKVAHLIFETTLAWLTQKEMTELLDYTIYAMENKRFHLLLIIGNFIIEFLKIHPFEDGNGRSSRVLTNMLLLKEGYTFMQYISHEMIIEQKKDLYYYALRSSQATFKTEKESIWPWLNFFLGVVKEQGDRAMLLVKNNTETDYSENLEIVLKYFQQNEMVRPAEIVQFTKINIYSVRKILEKLVKLNKIKKFGAGRGTRYIKVV